MTTTYAQDWKATQAARASAASALQASFPHLVPIAGKVDSLQAAAKNIRIELARAFPGVKFSVKSSRFSMGDSIDVRWTDGPCEDQVAQITGKYQAGSFDGMTDCYDYERSAWKEAFGDSKYIHTSRENTERAFDSAARTVFAKYAGNLDGVAVPTFEEFRKGSLYYVQVPGMNDDLQALIRREMYRRTWKLAAA